MHYQKGRTGTAAKMSVLLDQARLNRYRSMTISGSQQKTRSTPIQEIESHEVGKSEGKNGE
jgi:hypothetical protein